MPRRPPLPMTTIASLAVLAVAFTAPVLAAAADAAAEARAIVDRADRANTPPAMVETMTMVLTDETGKTFERRLLLWTRQGDEGDTSLMRFLAPDEIRGAGLLTVEHRGGEDDQWFYLPATRRIRRIAGGDRRNRFMGTEFLYEDLQGYHPEDYTFRLLPDVTVGGEKCRVVEARPKPEAASRSAYSRKVLAIGAATYLLRRAELFDADGTKTKVLTTDDVEEALAGIYLPGTVVVENLVNGRKTSLATVRRELPKSLDDTIFSQRNLRRRLRPDEK